MFRTEIQQMLRRWLRQPGFTAAAVLTLTLGIGATVAIFSVVFGVLLRPLPYADAERLVGLWHRAPGIGLDQFTLSYGSYTLFRERAQSFEEAGLYEVESFNVGGSGDPERLLGGRVTASIFSVLGTAPTIGRTFDTVEDQPVGPRVLVLSYGYWQRHFAGTQDVLGKVLQLDGQPWEVIGVMPKGFHFPNDEVDLWVPHPIAAEELSEVNFSYEAVARLRPGVTTEAASAEINALLQELPETYPGALSQELLEQSGITAYANPLRDDMVGDVRRLLWVLLAAVGFVLLIACANVANLLLVRAEGRQRELAVRVAMGAGRGRLAADLMLESVSLAALGGLFGVTLAWVGIRGLLLLEPANLPRLAEIQIDATVLLFALAVSLAAGGFLGLLPSLRLRRRVLGVALAEGGRGGTAARGSRRLRSALVVAQMALALVLLFSSALMLRTFRALSVVDPGFDRSSVLTLGLTTHGEAYNETEQRARFWTRLVDEARRLPGVAEAATVLHPPLSDGETNPGFIIEDFPPQPDDPPLVARQNLVSDGYFEAMGIPIVSGRTLERRDIEQRAPAVVVSSAFARRIWGETDPVGKRLKRGLPTAQDGPWYEVVGVAGDIRDESLDAEVVEMVYFPLLGLEDDEGAWTPGAMSLVLTSGGNDPSRLAAPVRELVRRLDPGLPVIGLRTMAEIARRSMAETTFTMVLLVIASIIAILLGSIGIYSVLAHSVAQRTREIGVRQALGADKGQVRGMLVGQGMRLAGIGVVIGLAGALAAGRVMAALLFGVSATDPPSFAAVVLLLVLVAAAASLIPAGRAARIAPSEALRYE